MKSLKILPLLTVLFLFTSCVEKITRIVHKDTIPPEYTVEQETLKNRISAIIPAEDISFGSSKTEKSGEAEYNTLTVEIQPKTLPEDVVSFFRMTGEIQDAVESGSLLCGNPHLFDPMCEIVSKYDDRLKKLF